MGSLLLTGIPAGIASAPTCGPARPSRTGFDQSWVAGCWLLHTLVVALHIHNGSACRFDKSPVLQQEAVLASVFRWSRPRPFISWSQRAANGFKGGQAGIRGASRTRLRLLEQVPLGGCGSWSVIARRRAAKRRFPGPGQNSWPGTIVLISAGLKRFPFERTSLPGCPGNPSSSQKTSCEEIGPAGPARG
jgi:hypothetical protein